MLLSPRFVTYLRQLGFSFVAGVAPNKKENGRKSMRTEYNLRQTGNKRLERIYELEEQIERQAEQIKRLRAFIDYVHDNRQMIMLGSIGEELLKNAKR